MITNNKFALVTLLTSTIIVGLAGCNIGNNNSNGGFISAATSGQCNPMTQNSCTITLQYNTNQVANLSIGYSATPQNQPAFDISSPLANCPLPQGSPGTQTCSITVQYNPAQCTYNNTSETVIFTLGNMQSNAIDIGCSSTT